MLRTQLYADPHGHFVNDLIFESCRRFPQNTALVDASCDRRIGYAEYAELVESLARGLVAAGLKPREVVAIFLPNSWEFCAAYHAATLAGAVPTPLNPTYREREVRYQLENAGAAILITDGPNLQGIDLSGLPNLRRVYATRQCASGTQPFSGLLRASTSAAYPGPEEPSRRTLAALPYSSGTTGLPKGVMLSHFNLVSNIYQLLGPNAVEFRSDDVILCCLPLYHIYGLNVVLNPVLTCGATLLITPRFHASQLVDLITKEAVTMMPLVPPAMNALCQSAERGEFPQDHTVRWVKCGAAPLAPELARRFTSLTGILVRQGYGMTEASPVTHVGFLDREHYRPESIGHPVALTDCRVLDGENAVAIGQPGELVMRGPQFMLGYWKAPEATAAVVREGWFWSGDIVTCDAEGFYYVVDRSKEMIKYKGFAIAPAEVEAVLLEHPAVRECGVVGRQDASAGEIPVAFVALRDGFKTTAKMGEELCVFVADRLTHYKQPREIRFVDSIPKTASGKLLRRELRRALR